MKKIGFIGAGNMANAIINGILSQGMIESSEICIYDVLSEKLEYYTQLGCNICETEMEIVETCKYIVLAVKPQNFEQVFKEIKSFITEQTVLISIAAGIREPYIIHAAGKKCKVVLVMPNTPLLIGFGSIAMSRGELVEEEEFYFVKGMFSCAGQVEEIDKDLMNEVIPINGSSPAFIYLIAKTVVDRAEQLGFDRDTANRLFCNTIIGAAQMMLTTDRTQDELINMVTSPGGTTLEGLEALRENNFEQAISAGFDACIRRAYELGK